MLIRYWYFSNLTVKIPKVYFFGVPTLATSIPTPRTDSAREMKQNKSVLAAMSSRFSTMSFFDGRFSEHKFSPENTCLSALTVHSLTWWFVYGRLAALRPGLAGVLHPRLGQRHPRPLSRGTTDERFSYGERMPNVFPVSYVMRGSGKTLVSSQGLQIKPHIGEQWLSKLHTQGVYCAAHQLVGRGFFWKILTE